MIVEHVVYVCRRSGLRVYKHYGSGTGPIWLDDVDCTGSETSLVECPHRGWADHNCHHFEDVSVLCSNNCEYNN